MDLLEFISFPHVDTPVHTQKACLSFIPEEYRKNRIPIGSPRTEPQLPEQPGQGTSARAEGQAAQEQNLTERNEIDRDDQPGLEPGPAPGQKKIGRRTKPDGRHSQS